jgi:hypothetical protein
MFKRAKISEVWNHFTVDSEQNRTAKCNICHLKLSFNLKNKHLITLQPTQSRQVSQNVPSSVTALASEASSSRSAEKHDDSSVSSTPTSSEQPSTYFENYISALYTKICYNKKNYGHTTKRNR